ncbi:unnamed protein product [Choristocarpus tenellus]
MWNLDKGVTAGRWTNVLERGPQSDMYRHGAYLPNLDVTFSPDGFSLAASDTLGRWTLYGTGQRLDETAAGKLVPHEQYFTSDMRGLVRDQNDNVLDAFTQQPPHLAQTGHVVDAEGNPAPEENSTRNGGGGVRGGVYEDDVYDEDWVDDVDNSREEKDSDYESPDTQAQRRRQRREARNRNRDRDEDRDYGGGREEQDQEQGVGGQRRKGGEARQRLQAMLEDGEYSSEDMSDTDERSLAMSSSSSSSEGEEEERGRGVRVISGSESSSGERQRDHKGKGKSKGKNKGKGKGKVKVKVKVKITSGGGGSIRVVPDEFDMSLAATDLDGEEVGDPSNMDTGVGVGGGGIGIGTGSNRNSVPAAGAAVGAVRLVDRHGLECAFCHMGHTVANPLPGQNVGVHPVLDAGRPVWVHDGCALFSPQVLRDETTERLCNIAVERLGLGGGNGRRATAARGDYWDAGSGVDVDRSWLTMEDLKDRKLYSYCPQVGEIVMYFPQGHMSYLHSFPEATQPPYKLFKGRPSVVRCQVKHMTFSFPVDYQDTGCYSVVCHVVLQVLGFPYRISPSVPHWAQVRGETQGDYPFAFRLDSFLENSNGVKVGGGAAAGDGPGGGTLLSVSLRDCGEADFLVPEAKYEKAVQYDWKINTRVMMAWEDESPTGDTSNNVIAGARAGAETGPGTGARRTLQPFYGRVAEVSCHTQGDEVWPNSPWECLVIEWDNDSDRSQLGPWEPRLVTWVEGIDPVPPDEDDEMWDGRCGIPTVLRESLSEVLQEAMESPDALPFLQRVAIEDYGCVVPVPMDLGLVQRRLKQNYYSTVDSLEFDCNLIYANCAKYNKPRSDIVKAAFHLIDTLVIAIRDTVQMATPGKVGEGAAVEVGHTDTGARAGVQGGIGLGARADEGGASCSAGDGRGRRREYLGSSASVGGDDSALRGSLAVLVTLPTRSVEGKKEDLEEEYEPRQGRKAGHRLKRRRTVEEDHSPRSRDDQASEEDASSVDDSSLDVSNSEGWTGEAKCVTVSSRRGSRLQLEQEERVKDRPPRARARTRKSLPYDDGDDGDSDSSDGKDKGGGTTSAWDGGRGGNRRKGLGEGEDKNGEGGIGPVVLDMLSRQGEYLAEFGGEKLIRQVAQEQWEEPPQHSMLPNVAIATLERLGAMDNGNIFAMPVQESQAPGYKSLVAHPRDFHTIREKAKVGVGSEGGGYRSAAELRDDLVLVFANCLTFNAPGTVYYRAATRLAKVVAGVYAQALQRAIRRLGKTKKGKNK